MEALIEHDGIDVWVLISTRLALITGVLRRAFGCWHLQMSLPFTRDNETYRTCVSCGRGVGLIWTSGQWLVPFITLGDRQLCTGESANRSEMGKAREAII